jgi:hypothetical protein
MIREDTTPHWHNLYLDVSGEGLQDLFHSVKHINSD